MNEEKLKRRRLTNFKSTQAYKERHGQSGLCQWCSEHVAERAIFQSGAEVFREKLKMCFDHLQKKRDSLREWRKECEPKKTQKIIVCIRCHSNPAELCSECKEKR